jgi:hypothetical protein
MGILRCADPDMSVISLTLGPYAFERSEICHLCTLKGIKNLLALVLEDSKRVMGRSWNL